MYVCDDNVGLNEVKNVMCYTTIPTLFVTIERSNDHIPTFFYIFSEMFYYLSRSSSTISSILDKGVRLIQRIYSRVSN